MNNCNCSNSDIVTSFEDSWNNIYTKSQSISDDIENINFYFLSDLIITNDDINNNINDLIPSLPIQNTGNSSSNFTTPAPSIPPISISFQCGKTSAMFSSISWDSTECTLTLTDAIQNYTDSLLFISKDDNSADIDASISIMDLVIHFNPSGTMSNITSPGILFQTMIPTETSTNSISLSFENLIVEGGFNTKGPLISVTQCLVEKYTDYLYVGSS